MSRDVTRNLSKLERQIADANVSETPAIIDAPAIQDAATLLNEPLILPSPIIPNILHHGEKMLVSSGSKARKTWLLMDCSVSVAAGKEWLNGYSVVQGRVLYVNLELLPAYCTSRIRTVCDERQITLEPGMLDVWNLRGHADKWPELKTQIAAGTYALIIIDPTYKLLAGRDENRTSDITALFNEFEAMIVRTGGAIACAAHYSKGNQASKEAIDRTGGSGVFGRDPDTIFTFTKHEEADCYTVEMTLRNHPPVEPFVVRWEYPLFIPDSLLDPSKLRKNKGAAEEQFHADKVAALLTKPLFVSDWEKKAEKELGMSRRTFFRKFGELRKNNAIVELKNGKWKRAKKEE